MEGIEERIDQIYSRLERGKINAVENNRLLVDATALAIEIIQARKITTNMEGQIEVALLQFQFGVNVASRMRFNGDYPNLHDWLLIAITTDDVNYNSTFSIDDVKLFFFGRACRQ